MKWFLAAVVALNLVVALYGTLKQRPPLDVHAQEVSPNAVKLLPASWKPDASAPAAASAPLGESALKSKPAASAPAASQPAAEKKAAAKEDNKPDAKADKQAQAEPAGVCYEWGALNDALLARVQGGLPQLKLQPGQQSLKNSETHKGSGRYWVHYPPLATQSETQTLSAELKDKGFDNYVVRNDDFKGHLSLGLFGKEAAARDMAARLKKAGYDKAAVDQKGKESTQTTLAFKKLDAAQADRLKALQKRLTPGIPLKGCEG